MTAWHARSEEALVDIAGLIHDAWFDFDRVTHDEPAEMLAVPFAQAWAWGPMLDDPAWRDAPKVEFVRNSWRGREERVPFMRGTLRIATVTSVTMDGDAGAGGALRDVRYDSAKGVVTVEGISGDLRARVRRLDVAAELLPEVALYVRRRVGRFGESEHPLWEAAP